MFGNELRSLMATQVGRGKIDRLPQRVYLPIAYSGEQ